MAENKNQHFVPEFYFKFFSEDGRTIRGCNLKSKKHFKGPLSNQSAKNYFYSNDIRIEKSFSPIEGRFKKVLKQILEKEDMSWMENSDYLELLRFISFQHKRTEYSKKQSESFADKFHEKIVKPMMKADKELMSKVSEEDINKTRMVYPAGFLHGVIYSLESNILLTDLIPILIINKSNKDFIFSDHPVIFYNLIYRDPTHPFEGISHPGLLVFCPISPKYALLLFDPEYYGVIKGDRNILYLKEDSEIKKINKLQFHGSMKNIYYSNQGSEQMIDSLSNEFFNDYSKEKELSQIKEIKNWKGDGDSLLVSSITGIPEKINFSFIKCGKPKRSVAVVRNKKLWEFFNERMNLYEWDRKI